MIDTTINSRNRHSFGEQFSARKWAREVAGQREILAAYGGVKLEDVRGMRAPFLSVIIKDMQIRDDEKIFYKETFLSLIRTKNLIFIYYKSDIFSGRRQQHVQDALGHKLHI